MTMAMPVDARPVHLYAQDPEVLQWGLQFCRSLGQPAAAGGDAAGAALAPAAADSAAGVVKVAPEGEGAPLGLLLYTPPAWAALRAAGAGRRDEALRAWTAAHAPLVRVAALHPEVRMVNALALLHAPQALAGHLLDQPPQACRVAPLRVDRGTLSPLAAELAHREGAAHEQAEALYQELEAMASLDSEALGLAAAERGAAARELALLRAALAEAAQRQAELESELAGRQAAGTAQAEAVQALQARLAEGEAELASARAARSAGGQDADILRLQVQQMQDELEAQLEAQREAGQALAAREAELATLRETAAASAGEAELLQAELQRAQEELEAQWQAHREAIRKLKAAEEAAARDASEREAQAAELAALRARPSTDGEMLRLREALAAREIELGQLRNAGTRDAEQLQAAREALAARESGLVQAREALAARESELAQARGVLAARESELAQAREAQAASAREAAQLKSVREALAAREAELAEAREAQAASARESDLLLAQLHETQEELERLFLQKREDEQRLEQQAAAARESESHSQRRVEQLARELEAQRQEEAIARSEVGARVAAAARQRDELLRDNELHLQQIQQMRDELEQYYLAGRRLRAAQERQARQAAAMRQFLHAHQPETVRLDLRGEVAGDGWHEAEVDGRWSGPQTESRLRLPALAAGVYHVQLDVVDAIAPDILAGASVSLGGRQLPLEPLEPGLPAQLTGVVEVPPSDDLEWEVLLRTPRVLAPRELGIEDDRPLGLRVRSLAFTRLG